MSSTSKKYFLFFVLVFLPASAIFFRIKSVQPVPPVVPDISTAVVTPSPTFTPARIPETISIENGPLKNSIIAAGDYLVRQQLANGELPYQVDFMSGERAYSPSYVRLVAGRLRRRRLASPVPVRVSEGRSCCGPPCVTQ